MQGKDELGRGVWVLPGEGPHGVLLWQGGLAAGRQRRSRSIAPCCYPGFGCSNVSPGSWLTNSKGAVHQTLGFLLTALLKKTGWKD